MRGPWMRLIATIIVLVVPVACAGNTTYDGDTFTSFRPPTDLFPPAPTADTTVQAGFVPPNHDVFGCWPWRFPDDAGEAASPWTGTRYDWSDSDALKSWVVGAQTAGYQRSPAEIKRDSEADAEECFSADQDSDWSVTGQWLDLDGLPKGTVAYELTSEVTLERPRPLHVYVATVIDGDTDAELPITDSTATSGTDAAELSDPTHVIGVYWLGWGTEVPADQFVTLVNTIVDAAHDASREPDVGRGSATAKETASESNLPPGLRDEVLFRLAS